MYIARGNEVYYVHPVKWTEELFITVHPTKDCARTPEEQARVIARRLNNE
jgi:hypothetical protein